MHDTDCAARPSWPPFAQRARYTDITIDYLFLPMSPLTLCFSGLHAISSVLQVCPGVRGCPNTAFQVSELVFKLQRELPTLHITQHNLCKTGKSKSRAYITQPLWIDQSDKLSTGR